MADVRTFRAATMQEALDLVRNELGADAVILHTRQVERRRLLPWRKPAEDVEITASLTLDVRASAKRKSAKRTTTNSARRAEGGTAVLGTTPSRQSMPIRSGGARLDLVSDPPESIIDILNRVRTSPNSREPVSAEGRNRSRPISAPLFEQSSVTTVNRLVRQSAIDVPTTLAADASDPTAALAQRLDTIQKMLHDLGRVGSTQRQEEIPAELFQLYTGLIDNEVEEDVARDLICRLKQTVTPRQISDVATAKGRLIGMVESEIRCSEPITPRPGRRKVVALVGATGVGKTTTIAKLAANFRLRSGVKMGLVTVDTYRVAAVEQLRTYAEIIELPMKVVTNPLEMRRALDELAGLDLVLIDTAGRSPKDDLQIQELKSLLAEAHVDEVHLVLSLTTSLRGLEASATKFAAAGTTAMILTKLDEASGMGSLLSVARRVNLPISYLTAGQAVPDDIEPAHPRRISRLVLGEERVTR
jgi:flagellar biosynthesis protein FlhF